MPKAEVKRLGKLPFNLEVDSSSLTFSGVSNWWSAAVGVLRRLYGGDFDYGLR